jgi:hypothetical protein
VRAIGVSNFGVPLLQKLAADARVKVVPATNQMELHPCLPLVSLRAYAKEAGIVLTAYSPIGAPVPGEPSPLLDDEDVVRIARTHGATPAQVLLSWNVQNGVIVIPKTESVARMKANISVRRQCLVWPSSLMCGAALDAECRGHAGDRCATHEGGQAPLAPRQLRLPRRHPERAGRVGLDVRAAGMGDGQGRRRGSRLMIVL